MILRVRLRHWRMLRNFTVTDASGELFCTVEQQLCFPTKLFLYDGDGNVFASLRRLWRIPKTFLLSCEGREITMRRKLMGRRYILSPVDWHTKRSLLYTDHSILDRNEEPIARIEYIPGGCNIHCMQKGNHLPVLLFALAVQKRRGTMGTTNQ